MTLNPDRLMRNVIIPVILGLLVICGLAAVLRPSKEPQIVVNMPADAKPLATLTQPGDKVIGPDRAVFYWTIYQKTSSGGWGPSTCADIADRAVNTVYGPLKP